MIDFEKLRDYLPPHMRLNMAMGMLLAGEVVLSVGAGAGSVRDLLAREAREAEDRADAEERGEVPPMPGQRAWLGPASGTFEAAGAIYDASQVLDPDGTSRLLAMLHALALSEADDEDGPTSGRCDP